MPRPEVVALGKLRALNRSTTKEAMAIVSKGREELAIQLRRLTKGKRLTQHRERQQVYRGITKHWEAIAAELDEWMIDKASGVPAFTRKQILEEKRIHGAGAVKGTVTKFDRSYVRDVFARITPANEKHLAAVFTKRMTEEYIGTLRAALTQVEREGAVKGMTLDAKAREIKKRWQALVDEASDAAGPRPPTMFIDRAGRRWKDERYMEMLVRTTNSRVTRDTYIDQLAAEGDDLVKIEAIGDSCEICTAWNQVIISISGASEKHPSYQDAINAGMFHPNCDCLMSRVDETLHEEEIAQQAKTQTPGDLTDLEAITELKKKDSDA